MSPSRASGRAGRRWERRRRRRRQLLAVLAVAVLLALVVTVYFARRSTPPPASAAAATSATTSTLLVQLRGGDGGAVSAALLALRSGAGAELLVPPQVLATAPGAPARPYGAVLALGPDASRAALSDLLGVRVDRAWVLDLPAAAQLVDAVGGVPLDVDVPVLSADGSPLLQPGRQQVDGQRAVAFATYLAAGEPEQARLARLQGLLDGLLDALPRSAPQVGRLLAALGSGSVVSGADPAQLPTVLAGLSAADRSGTTLYDTVPVVTVDTGAATPGLRLDADAARGTVDRLLSGAVLPGARQSGNRVLVFDGVGTPGLPGRVRDALVAAGLRYVSGGPSATPDVAASEVQVADGSAGAVALGRRVAHALGLPGSAVRIGRPTSLAEVVLVVGADLSGLGASGSGSSSG